MEFRTSPTPPKKAEGLKKTRDFGSHSPVPQVQVALWCLVSQVPRCGGRGAPDVRGGILAIPFSPPGGDKLAAPPATESNNQLPSVPQFLLFAKHNQGSHRVHGAPGVRRAALICSPPTSDPNRSPFIGAVTY